MNSCAIELIPPNIRNEIVSESGLTRRTSRLEFFLMKPHESPRINKKSIRGDSWPVWKRDIKRYCSCELNLFSVYHS